MGPSLKPLYFHPVGILTSLDSPEWADDCVVLVVGPFLASAMGSWSRASTYQLSNGAIGTSIAPYW